MLRKGTPFGQSFPVSPLFSTFYEVRLTLVLSDCNHGIKQKAQTSLGLYVHKTLSENISCSHRKSESVMVTPKKCKFLQLCEHQLSVKVTPTWCTFTPQ